MASQRASVRPRPVSGQPRAASARLVPSAARKAARRRERAALWRTTIEGRARERARAEASASAPLSHLDALQESLAAIARGGTRDGGRSVPRSEIRAGAAAATRGRGMSARARGRVLAAERAQFAAVMAHPVFRRDPSAAIHGHISHRMRAERQTD